MRKSIIMLATVAGLATGATVAFAQMVDGEVTKVDESAGKITIKHGPIKKFDMEGGMTMVFPGPGAAQAGQARRQDQIRSRQSEWSVHRHEDREEKVGDAPSPACVRPLSRSAALSSRRT
jgi:Cu/Ag efflux protein CusF